jgi:hypothetical protein
MTDLEKLLLDVTTNKILPEDLEKVFDEISVALLRQTKLVAGQSEYSIKEVEFYFSGDYYNHFDSYTHSNQYETIKRQGEFGEWYFHRYKSPENYVKQKFRGLDLTFGNKEFKNFGGILIRQIQNIETLQIIDGISNIVGEIIKNIDVENFHKIATETGKFAFDKNCMFYTDVFGNSYDKPIYKSARVLPKPNSEEKAKYYQKFYRYFNNPEIKQVLP